VSRHTLPHTNYVLGSKESPNESQYFAHSQLFLGGPLLVPGQRYSLLRQVEDPNREDSAIEQHKKLKHLGVLYQDIGWITVTSVEKSVSIATFEFACNTAIPGDLVVPYEERPTVAFRKMDGPVAPFVANRDAVKGSIIAAKDFDGLLGTGQTVYTDYGSTQGAKPGDYLFVVRGYTPGDLNRMDRVALRLPKGDDPSAVNEAKIAPDADRRVPDRVVGEVLVLTAGPDSSTALITRSLAEMELGDILQVEDGQSTSAVAASDTAASSAPCQPASRLHRWLLLHPHACK
jgi:hypothetical protein